MSWPLSQDYNEAVQSPQSSFGDAELRSGRVAVNPLGIPLPRSGNFADVYELRCPNGSRWAVKCFTREVSGLRERYQQVSRHLRHAQLPFTVDFTFLEQGIRVRGRWYPVLKMQWIEGLTLNEFVRQYADKPDKLEALLQIWLRMAGRLRSAGIAHGDLQHGNLLLVPGSSANLLAAKLIDYDGMFVPALAGRTSGEVGHPCYQHPQRMRERVYGPDVDRFPFLLIAAALCGLQVGGRALWNKYDSGDNLLFREADLQAPVKSPLFYELLKLGEARSRRIVEHTLEALRGDLTRVPLLEEVLEPSPLAATPATKAGAAATQVLRVAPNATTHRTQRRPIIRPPRMQRPKSWLAAGLVAASALLALTIGSLVLFFSGGSPPPPSSPRADEPPEEIARNDPSPPRIEPAPKRDASKMDKPILDASNSSKTEVSVNPPPQQIENPLRLAAEKPNPRELFTCRLRHLSAVRAVSVAGKSRRAVSLGEEGDLHLWDLDDGKWLGGLRSPDDDVLRCAALTPDGKHVLAGGKGKVLYLIDIEKKTSRRAFKEHAEAVNQVDLSPDGTQALSGGDDKIIRHWDVAKEKEIDKWTAHEKAIDFIRFSANGRLALTSSLDGKIHVWDAAEGRSSFFLAPQPGSPPPSSVALSPNGDRVVAGLRDGSILLFLVAGQKKRLGPFREHDGPVHTTAFTPDGRYLATASGDAKSATSFLWYAEGVKFRRVPFVKQAISPRALAFTADGRRAVVGSPDGTVRVWDVYGSASSSHEKIPEPSAPPPIKRGARLVEEPSGPLVHKLSPAPPKPGTQPRLGQKMQNSVGMKLTYIPPGKFRMGSSEEEIESYKKLPNRGYDPADSWKEEVPQHEVRITKGFYLGVFEVTQGEYEKVMGTNPSSFKESKDHPVDTVTWQDGMVFCRKLSELPDEKKAGRNYRLPTEAEWEYACRAGTTKAFHYGDSLSSKEANFNGMAPFGDALVPKAPSLGKTVKVGSYDKPNVWGLYDMHGNVWEWCLDGPRKYTPEAVDDPRGSEGDVNRPLRGGCWRDGAVRSAFRKARDGAKYRINICGLRVLCEQQSP